MARSSDADGGPAGNQHEEEESNDIWICDFTDADDRADFARLMAEFAAEPVSASPQLGVAHFERVAADLARRAGTLVLLAARAESEATEGVLIAFEGYSSFARGPLFNIHDVHVTPTARGAGLGSALVETLAELGREHGHAKLTLEVSATNTGAIRLYRRLGFAGLENLPAVTPAGVTYFATKKL
jgi:ribosomal protein S18 acetylase RimI-like enzyme